MMQSGRSKIASFEITGAASLGRVRAAAGLDAVLATLVAMLLAPQPLLRAIISAALPSPAAWVPVYVVILLASILLVFWIYLMFSVVRWGRTPSMYLFDLGLETPDRPGLAQGATWAAGWTLALVPALIGVRAVFDPGSGWPARFSGLKTGSTATG